MIAFKGDLLRRVRTGLESLPPAGRADIDKDLQVFSEQRERYQRRLEFWYARHWELEGLVIDQEARRVACRDRSVTLTRREFQLLAHLVAETPRFVSARRLLVDAWHDGHLPEESLRTYIVRLRAKLERLDAGVAISNQARRGYALVFAKRR